MPEVRHKGAISQSMRHNGAAKEMRVAPGNENPIMPQLCLICLTKNAEQRDVFVRPEDYHISPNGIAEGTIEFDLAWADLTDEEGDFLRYASDFSEW